ncbi:hypothetical protein [Marinomonas colpomeniae]|uniref:Phage abortive infection protein n=1 Tax=Marinomonas colpomeniae TaxID=2774408 RepID=A0ABR8NTU6_9GAMM|nr:hypothetical protein [Marinomonas colpomeniae]MBD5769471.1 hypothetical protein [Marinomonas colpomeniae]
MASFLDSVQIGFDMATSLTIVGAAVTWFIRQKKQAAIDKERGISQQVKSTGLQKVQTVLLETENSFSSLVTNTQKFEKMIDNRFQKHAEKPYRKLNLALTNDEGFFDKSVDLLEGIRKELGGFYEMIQVRRYSLIPLLDSINDGENYVSIFQKNIDDVGEAHNNVGSSNLSLLKELKGLIDMINEKYDFKPDSIDDEQLKSLYSSAIDDSDILDKIKSILFDEDYFEWLSSFVSEGSETAYLEKVIRSNEIEDRELFHNVLTNFIVALFKRNIELISTVLVSASYNVMNARIECKDILISLSAMSHKLVVNNDVEPLIAVIEKYNSNEYFSRDRSIR